MEIHANNTLDLSSPQPYWRLDQVVAGGEKYRKKSLDPNEAADRLDALLTDTIADKMVADVPLGAFLSGGIDSSTVVALMQTHSNRPVKTFSIGFHESEYNEAEYARAVAGHLGTDHTELYVTPGDTLSVIPRIPELYDEPFSDSSQIPTYLISQLARRDVTVALSGDGGDELFGGYSRYLVGLEAWRRINRIPAALRRNGGKLIHKVPPHYIDQLIKPIRPLLPRAYRYKQIGQKLHKLAGIWNTTTTDSVYSSLITLWQTPETVVTGANNLDMLANHHAAMSTLDNFTERMMFADTVTYLPDDILVKVDRASMAVSLEVRVPFLDHRVIEFAWKLAPELKIAGNQGKRVLRQVLKRYVPENLYERPKMGFGVPIDHWLRGPLREWAGDLLSPDRLIREGFLNPGPVQEKWQEHLSGKASWHYLLWPVLMFQAWHEHWHAQ
jgi:asparagine synthase (glutamine-hydrolysing)